MKLELLGSILFGRRVRLVDTGKNTGRCGMRWSVVVLCTRPDRGATGEAHALRCCGVSGPPETGCHALVLENMLVLWNKGRR